MYQAFSGDFLSSSHEEEGIDKAREALYCKKMRSRRSKFEDTQRHSCGLDPSGSLRRTLLWIFDNQVEHASREKQIEFGLIILTVL